MIDSNVLIKPVRLYVKKHSKTGLLYFGKTSVKDIDRYKGSGRYWKDHIKIHGVNYVVTLWVSDWFYNVDDIVNEATTFSYYHDIVRSDKWANLMPENGLDGAAIGRKLSQIQRDRLSEYHWAKGLLYENNPNTGSKRTQETKDRISIAKKGRSNGHAGMTRSTETKQLLSKMRRGNNSNMSQSQKDRSLTRYKEILALYNAKPSLSIPYNCVSGNGKIISYENAFSKEFAKIFDLSSKQISNIILGKVLLLKEMQ